MSRSILPEANGGTHAEPNRGSATGHVSFTYHAAGIACLHVLTEADVRRLLDPRALIPVIAEAFRNRYRSTLMPTRTQMKVSGGIFLIMPCYDQAGNGLGMKLVKFSEAPRKPDERIQATYILLDIETGCTKLVIPANYLTDARTAATSAVATKFLSRPDAKVLGVFGTGRQARAHLEIVRYVRDFERALVTGKEAGRTREFAQQMEHELGMKIEPVYSRTCAAESDVLCACTTSSEPLFDGTLLRKGTHINAVGSFRPNTREVDDFTVRRSRIVVDTYDGALTEAGDLLIPLKAGLIRRENILADLYEVTSGRKVVRTNPADITLFKSVGNALEDLAAAELLEQVLTSQDLKSTPEAPTPSQGSSSTSSE